MDIELDDPWKEEFQIDLIESNLLVLPEKIEIVKSVYIFAFK